MILKARSTSASTDCVLLFSGGRDSTVAAVRLAPHFPNMTLLTLTTEHLIDLERVSKRLKELKRVMPETAKWVHAVAHPTSLVTIGEEIIESCLPCHHVYVKTAMVIAKGLGASTIAVGYASYQNTWLEQTPYAVETLQSVVAEFGMTLLLPASDLTSKADAISILTANGLSSEALEQKCLKQQFNTQGLSAREAKVEIDSWKLALRKSFSAGTLDDVDLQPNVPWSRW